MKRQDVTAVLEISGWSRAGLMRCLRTRNCVGMVAELHGRIAGFMIYELHDEHLDLLKFVVHSAYRRRGVGTAMIRRVISKLSDSRFVRVTLEVRETDVALQLFLRAHGFRAVSVLRRSEESFSKAGYLMQFDRADEPFD